MIPVTDLFAGGDDDDDGGRKRAFGMFLLVFIYYFFGRNGSLHISVRAHGDTIITQVDTYMYIFLYKISTHRYVGERVIVR